MQLEEFNPVTISEAITVLNRARLGCAEGCHYAWSKLRHAADYLEQQIDEHFAEVAA